MRFLARRVIASIVTLLVVTMLVFGLSRIQGDPRSLLISEDATQKQWHALGQELGLDQPVYKQYLLYVTNLVKGDMGDSTLQRKPVVEILWSRIPNTAMLAAAAFAFAILIGVPLGVLSAVKRGGFWDHGVRSFAVLGAKSTLALLFLLTTLSSSLRPLAESLRGHSALFPCSNSLGPLRVTGGPGQHGWHTSAQRQPQIKLEALGPAWWDIELTPGQLQSPLEADASRM